MKSKIVHIVLNAFVQDSRVMRECKTLAEKGYEVTVIAYWMEDLLEDEFQDGYTIKRLRLKTKSWTNNSIVQVFKYFEFLFKGLFIINKIKPRVCHGHDLSGLFIAYFAKVILNCFIIYDSHELWSDSVHLRGKKKLLYKIGSKIEKFLINKANFVITVNQSIAEILMRKNNIASVNVLRNMPYKSANNKIVSKIESGFPNCKFNLIYTGNVEKGRGMSRIIGAFKFVHPDVGLAIMGRNSDYRNKMVELVKSSNLENRIKFISAVLPDEVVNFCKLADIGIAPIKNICKSYYLSLPNKIFEYIQAGIPVISSDFPEMKRVIDEYNIGNTFDVEDELNIAKAINTLHNDGELYKIYSNNSKYAAEYLNWDVEQSKLIDCYQQLAL